MIETPHETLPARSSHARKLVAGIVMFCAAVAAGASATVQPVQAQERPVLVVGGHATTNAALAESIAWLEERGFTAYGIELSREQPWNWPGTASNVDSAMEIAYEVAWIKAQENVDKIDIVAISQGILATRYYMKQGGAEHVAGVISWSGVNYGIPPDFWIQLVCNGGSEPTVCNEVVNDNYVPNSTPFLQQLNSVPLPGSPNVDYYHIYTNTSEPYNQWWKWAEIYQIPAPGQNALVQAYCPGRMVYHAGFGTDLKTDKAMGDLLVHALKREPLTTDCPCQTNPPQDGAACTPDP